MKNVKEFIRLESMSAILLLSMTLLALIMSNSPWEHYYQTLLHTSLIVQIGKWKWHSDLLFYINDGLMTLFFLVVAAEIKYELLQGTLNTLPKALLPGIAALGGIIVPALIYTLFNYQNPTTLTGWAIPTATDIAFALGILSLLGSRVPPALKVFLTALAIFDDLVAIVIISIFYTAHFSLLAFTLATLCFVILWLLNRYNVTWLPLYITLGIILWLLILNSGIHATVAGVLLASVLPLGGRKASMQSPLSRVRDKLHPWIAMGVLPLFAFANAGTTLIDLSASTVHYTILLGSLCGLFLGKQLGIFLACWLSVKFKLAHLPPNIRWPQIYAVAIVSGIGFTISLFIGTLSFGDLDASYLNSVKIGVLVGSLLSGAIGYLMLRVLYDFYNIPRHARQSKIAKEY